MPSMTFVLLSVLLGCVNANCEWKFGNSCYQLLNEMMTWNEARQACSAIGASLAVSNSQEENRFIKEMMKYDQRNEVWIGCTDMDIEGTWMQAGEAGKECNFINWAPGEPNGDASWDEDCAQMWGYVAGQWVDNSCSAVGSVICEYYSSIEMTCRQAGADGRFA